MNDLIERLRVLSRGMAFEPSIRPSVVKDINEAADALERLTAGDVELPEPCVPEGDWLERDCYIRQYAKDYGDRRAAAAVLCCAVLAEREPAQLAQPAPDKYCIACRKTMGAKPVRTDREHVISGTECWCCPEVDYVDPLTGVAVIVHHKPN